VNLEHQVVVRPIGKEEVLQGKRIRKETKAGQDHSRFREGRPARACLVEVIGVQPSRTKVKRRKAISERGELALSSNALFPLPSEGVLTTRWLQSLWILPEEPCRVPRER